MLKAIFNRYIKSYQRVECGDFINHCWVVLLTRHGKIDTTQNCFSFLQTMFINEGRLMAGSREQRQGIMVKSITTMDCHNIKGTKY